jgi:hypothetical protein
MVIMPEEKRWQDCVFPISEHAQKDGETCLTKRQILELLNTCKYIVTGPLSYDHDTGCTGSALYKGSSEAEAKKIWLGKPSIQNHLFCEYGIFKEPRCWIDLNDVKHDFDPIIANFSIGFYPPDDSLGEMVLTRPIMLDAENLWYVVRVCDVDLPGRSYIGQIVYRGSSKQEAVNEWMKYRHRVGNTDISSCYIFNPFLCSHIM